MDILVHPTGELQENITVHNAWQSERLQPGTAQLQYYLCKKSDELTECEESLYEDQSRYTAEEYLLVGN
jgi:hypothetical protein